MGTLRSATIPVLFNLTDQILNGVVPKNDISKLYQHEDYLLEIERYTSRDSEFSFPTPEIIETISGFSGQKPTPVNNDSHPHIKRIVQLLNNIEVIKSKWKGFTKGWESVITAAKVKAAEKLPKNIQLPDFDILITVGIGNSFGWPYKNVIHFDFIEALTQYESIQQLENLIAHELHHIGFQKYFANFSDLDNWQEFLFFFAFEGLAIKSFNHPETLFSPIIEPARKNYVIEVDDWDYFRAHYTYYFSQFCDDFAEVSNNPNIDMGKIYKKWFTSGRIDSSEKQLSQYPNYLFGTELFGMLLARFGLEEIFLILEGKSDFIEKYNEVLESHGLSDFKLAV